MSQFNFEMRACAALFLWATAAVTLPAQTFTTLHSFQQTDGAGPISSLVQAADGNLYGTTQIGGTNGSGDGTVFKITRSGMLTSLYSFCSLLDCPDGALPGAALVQGPNGNFYGTTTQGGTAFDFGTVFTITPGGALTTLHDFCTQSPCTDGGVPFDALIVGPNGNFYGTTSQGGSTAGTVFKITSAGVLTTLHPFAGQDGNLPTAGLAPAADGNFYGTTYYGGAADEGTVFKITPGGALTSLYGFCSQSGCPDGENPMSGLVQAADGSLYGTTVKGGANDQGTIFKITTDGTFTTVYSFCAQSLCADGGLPHAALIQATDGNLYGTTTEGGAGNLGTIFTLTPAGALTTLYNFCALDNCRDGDLSYAALIQDTDGKFYGTTTSGGGANFGTVFSLSVGLAPFVETQPASGKVGIPVTILGTNLTGATSVKFNGVAAVFTVVSSSEITTTVPAGAITGTVKVKIAGHTLTSNVPFRVK
jgi:uncharacterized repeat protein (TIGR03803 family)